MKQAGGGRGAFDGRVAFGWVVQDDGREPTQQDHSELGEFVLERLGVVGKETGRTQLGRGETESGHFAENAIGRQHGTPIGDLADSPRDGCGGDAGDKVRH